MSAKTTFKAVVMFLDLLAKLLYDFVGLPNRLMTQRRGVAHLVLILVIIIIVLLVLIFLTI